MTAPRSGTAAKTASGLPVGHLLYLRHVGDAESESAIYKVGAGETDGRAVIKPPEGIEVGNATASPDGARFAFTRCADHCDVWTANSDGSSPRRLSRKCEGVPPTCVEESNPVFSPDGRTIVYGRAWGHVEHDQIQHADLFLMPSSGGEATRLTRLSDRGYNVDVNEASFSPDGKHVVFEVVAAPLAPHGGHHAVFTVDVDGAQVHRLTPWEFDAGDHPRFSPDGSLILFRTDPDDGPGGDLYTMRPDGSQRKPVTHLTGMRGGTFSADGEYIAYSRIAHEDDEPHIWVMKANGTGAKRLTTGPQADTGVTWGP